MDLLQFLLSFFKEEYGDKYKNVIELVQNNSFDIKSILKNLNFETVLPIIKDIFGGIKNFSPHQKVQAEGLSPIKNIADEKIIFALNEYLDSSFN